MRGGCRFAEKNMRQRRTAWSSALLDRRKELVRCGFQRFGQLQRVAAHRAEIRVEDLEVRGQCDEVGGSLQDPLVELQLPVGRDRGGRGRTEILRDLLEVCAQRE